MVSALVNFGLVSALVGAVAVGTTSASAAPLPATAAGGAAATAAVAAAPRVDLPSEVPSTGTPWVQDGQVQRITQVGNTMIAGGQFSTVAEPMGGQETLALHEDRLYVGGNFQRAGGVDHAGFTAFGPITGDLDPFVGAGFRTPQRHRHRSPRTGLTQ